MNIAICGAKARSNSHRPCRLPAMANGRCRFHGGLSTGAKTPEGKLRQEASRKVSSWKHGYYASEVIDERRHLRRLQQESKNLLHLSKRDSSELDT